LTPASSVAWFTECAFLKQGRHLNNYLDVFYQKSAAHLTTEGEVSIRWFQARIAQLSVIFREYDFAVYTLAPHRTI
jgi:hypothetical protein